jgi:hypothetical protein
MGGLLLAPPPPARVLLSPTPQLLPPKRSGVFLWVRSSREMDFRGGVTEDPGQLVTVGPLRA